LALGPGSTVLAANTPGMSAGKCLPVSARNDTVLCNYPVCFAGIGKEYTF